MGSIPVEAAISYGANPVEAAISYGANPRGGCHQLWGQSPWRPSHAFLNFIEGFSGEKHSIHIVAKIEEDFIWKAR